MVKASASVLEAIERRNERNISSGDRYVIYMHNPTAQGRVEYSLYDVCVCWERLAFGPDENRLKKIKAKLERGDLK